jgi:beta-lactamase regulating signal transducer with metallopeptidase domain
MTSLIAIRVLLFAGECFAASSAVVALAWLAAFRLRRASLRHLVWAVSFGVLIALPVAGALVPARFVLERAAEEPKVPVMIADAGPVPDMASVAVASSDIDPDPMPAPASAPEARGWTPGAGDLVLALAGVWLLGVLLALGRLALGAFGLAALRRRSRPHAVDPALLPPVAATRRACELRLSETQHGPMTWGVIAPVVLLPRNATTWPRERLMAVLLHELAHVRRKDSLTRALSLLICVFYWPNPLVWVAAKALRREAEIAADDAVVSAGVKPSVYAGELLSLASEFRGTGLAAASVSMAQRSALETRVKSVLEPNVSRKGVTAMDVVKTACLGVAAAALLAVMRPDVVDAQDVNVQPAPATVAAPADVPPPPPPPPPAPPAPEVNVAPLPPPPPVAAVPPVPPPPPNVHVSRRIRIETDGRDVHVDQAEIDRAVAEAHRAEAELARIQPAIQQALAAAKVDAKVAKALEKTRPQIEAEVRRAMAEAEPEIRKALAQAKMSEHVRIRIEKARASMEAAAAKMSKDADEAGRETDEDRDDDADRDDEK